VRYEIRDVLFLDRNRILVGDGHLVAIEGTGDLKPLVAMAMEAKLAPQVAARAAGGKVAIERITVGKQVFLEGGSLERLARFDVRTGTPRRSRNPRDDSFLLVESLPIERTAALKPLLGARISLAGTIVLEGDRRVLRMADGAGVVLNPLPVGSRLEPFLAAFAGEPSTVQLDLVLTQLYKWVDPKTPARSRQAGRLAGEADVYSASAQSFDLVGRR
jgi:hypothetical protein